MMDQAFTAILLKLVAEQGKEALLNPLKCKSILADYTRNEYQRERRLILHALEAGSTKAIDSAPEPDLSLCKRQQAKRLREEYFLDEEIARDLVDMLALTLRGDRSRTEPPKDAGNDNKNIPQPKRYYYAYYRKLFGPYEKSYIEGMLDFYGDFIADENCICMVGNSQREPIMVLFFKDDPDDPIEKGRSVPDDERGLDFSGLTDVNFIPASNSGLIGLAPEEDISGLDDGLVQ